MGALPLWEDAKVVMIRTTLIAGTIFQVVNDHRKLAKLSSPTSYCFLRFAAVCDRGLQIFAIINASSVMYSGKKAQHDFPKMRGGDQRPFGTFPKIHHFWRCHPSLILVQSKIALLNSHP